MAKLITEIKCTELDIVKELIDIFFDHYPEMPEGMRIEFNEWIIKYKENDDD